MKCPKCDYISFGDLERCSNCGYDVTLASDDAPAAELALRRIDSVEGPRPDLTLAAGQRAAGADARPSEARGAGAPLQPNDLPLFDRPVPGVDDTPLLTAPAAPRAPLSVRRATPDTPRAPVPATGSVAPGRTGRRRHVDAGVPDPGAVDQAASRPGLDATTWPDAAPPGLRAAAAAVDAVILGAIDGAVVYFTLQVTGLDLANLWRLPAVPLVAFLALLDFGYLVGFTTASGQTIGKMLTGLYVVADGTTRVALGQAVIRAAGVGLTLLSIGTGYLPALIGRDRRALHDRLAATRVLRR